MNHWELKKKPVQTSYWNSQEFSSSCFQIKQKKKIIIPLPANNEKTRHEKIEN